MAGQTGSTANKAKGPTDEEIKLRKKLDELEKENKKVKEEKAQAEEKLKEASTAKETENIGASGTQMNPETQAVLMNLQKQVEDMKRELTAKQQSITVVSEKDKPMFRPVTTEDWQEESVVFTARSIFYVIGSYKNSMGIDVAPPHKIIAFEYAASDRRMEGREETILNYCQFTTNLKSEIEFLRNHPHYGITFSENINQMMDEDIRETQFKVRAASMVNAMNNTALFNKCKTYKIPYHGKRIEELKILVIHQMSKEFVEHSKKIEEERVKRIAVGAAAISDRE